MRRFGAGVEAPFNADPTTFWAPSIKTTSGDTPTSGMTDVPYGPSYEPAYDTFLQYKWWIIGGGVGLFLLAGGSILGLSLRKRRKMGSHRRSR
jgi:hypothetical protein